MTAVRFYRAGGGAGRGETLVDVFCRIPLGLIERLNGPEGGGAYRLTVSVRDSSGLELVTQSWSGTVSADVTAGTYTLAMPRSTCTDFTLTVSYPTPA